MLVVDDVFEVGECGVVVDDDDDDVIIDCVIGCWLLVLLLY